LRLDGHHDDGYLLLGLGLLCDDGERKKEYETTKYRVLLTFDIVGEKKNRVSVFLLCRLIRKTALEILDIIKKTPVKSTSRKHHP
jgi:hypothetical protein